MSLLANRFYIAGPMRGLPDLNYRQFNGWAHVLREQGFKVSNPAENFGGDQTRELKEYYKVDFGQLVECSDILFLPGWENSSGARIEYLIARDLELNMHLTVGGLDSERPYDYPTYRQFAETDHPVELTAGQLVRKGARQQVYGHPMEDFSRTSKMADALGMTTQDDPRKVALFMIALKLSRLVNTPDHHDSVVDIIGYAVCLSMINQRMKNEA